MVWESIPCNPLKLTPNRFQPSRATGALFYLYSAVVFFFFFFLFCFFFFCSAVVFGSKVSHELVAELAHAVHNEVQLAFGENSTKLLPSAKLVQNAHRAYVTGHSASGIRAVMESIPAVMASLEVTNINIGLDRGHPVIFPSNYVKSLAENGKLLNLTGGKPFSCLTTFWEKLQPLRPQHPVYKLPKAAWKHTIPVYLIADEGRGFKKSQVMVLGSEPVLGEGCDAEDAVTASEPLKMNFRGNTYKTRQLYTVLPKKIYSKDDAPLHDAVNQWADDLRNCFSGLRVQHEGEIIELRMAVLGLKADWPALSKLGRLERSFAREAYPSGHGICHLCAANSSQCPQWHHHDLTMAPWIATMSAAELPWKPNQESGLTAKIPMEPGRKQRFYLVDIFHTCHKGVHADVAGSGIDAELHMGQSFSVCRLFFSLL